MFLNEQESCSRNTPALSAGLNVVHSDVLHPLVFTFVRANTDGTACVAVLHGQCFKCESTVWNVHDLHASRLDGV